MSEERDIQSEQLLSEITALRNEISDLAQEQFRTYKQSFVGTAIIWGVAATAKPEDVIISVRDSLWIVW